MNTFELRTRFVVLLASLATALETRGGINVARNSLGAVGANRCGRDHPRYWQQWIGRCKPPTFGSARSD